MKIRSAHAFTAVALVLAGCDAAPSDATAASAAPTAVANGAPAGDKAPEMKPADARPAEEPSEDATEEQDMSSLGAPWEGFKITVPAGTKMADDGAGGVSIAMKGGKQLSISSGPALVKDIKSGAEAGAKFGKGKVEFTTDTDDALDYVMEGEGPGGDKVKAWGFATNVELGDKKYGCSGAGIMDEADVKKLKDICASLKK